VAHESVKEQIFDVGYLEAVKATSKLKQLLTSVLVPISDMSHDGLCDDRTIEEEGHIHVLQFQSCHL
jgi:hypothetical protein